jgi:hypothetical protein
MSTLEPFLPEDGPEDTTPVLDTPIDYRPDLSALGMMEVEKGVVEDTYENRAALRKAMLNWDPVYDQSGAPTGLIAARSQEATKERRLMSLAEKKPLLLDPGNNNSDFLTGLDLLLEDEAVKICPPWVIGATRVWQAEQETGPKSAKRAPAAMPHRCTKIKSDGIRCMLWSSGRLKDDGLCRVHLKTIRRPGADVERARTKIMQSASYAVDKLEELMESAVSEPVQLKAATEILDRAGVRGGTELDIGVDISGERPAHVIVAERLQRLASGAASAASHLVQEDVKIIDAEVTDVYDITTAAKEEDGPDPDAGK